MAKKLFDKEFKINAVSLVIDKGLLINRVRRDLGIGQSTLRRWIREIKKQGTSNAFPVSGHCRLDEERLRKT